MNVTLENTDVINNVAKGTPWYSKKASCIHMSSGGVLTLNASGIPDEGETNENINANEPGSGIQYQKIRGNVTETGGEAAAKGKKK